MRLALREPDAAQQVLERHTRASLDMARSTPLKWIQQQGGWASAKLLLDTYGHFMPSESSGSPRIWIPLPSSLG